MKIPKEPLDHQRLRRLPPQGFSWIDRRFVREGFIEDLPPEAILLYFFLVAVSDAQGLSFYADPTISRILKLNAEELSQARTRLVDRALILYKYPLYQVLSLPRKREPPKHASSSAFSPTRTQRGGEPIALNEFLKLALRKAQGPRTQNQSKERP